MAFPRIPTALLILSTLGLAPPAIAQSPPASATPSPATVAELVSGIRARAKALEGTPGMRLGFQSFQSRFRLPSEAVSYSDFVIVRLLFETTRDAGLWNLHWVITNRQPNSNNVWRQWQTVRKPSYTAPTAAAECDELSALFSFLARSLGIRGVGLFWPYSNHTVAVWEIHPTARPAVRVVVPTTQIFLSPNDFFGTGKFDPWRQRAILEYARRDAPPSFEIPRPLLGFFLAQAERYGGATDSTLQRLRYLREAVFQHRLTPEQAAAQAVHQSSVVTLAAGPPEDVTALAGFAEQMGR